MTLEDYINKYYNRSKSIRDAVIPKAESQEVLGYLKALKEIWDSGDCNNCKAFGYCRIEPKVGQLVRFNCYHYSGKGDDEDDT